MAKADDLGNLCVNIQAGSISIGGASTIGDGSKTVTTAGTAVALASSTQCTSVTVAANEGNTGTIVVGASTVVASLASRRGIPLKPLDTFTVNIGNLSSVFIDATVNGDGVTYTYVK